MPVTFILKYYEVTPEYKALADLLIEWALGEPAEHNDTGIFCVFCNAEDMSLYTGSYDSQIEHAIDCLYLRAKAFKAVDELAKGAT